MFHLFLLSIEPIFACEIQFSLIFMYMKLLIDEKDFASTNWDDKIPLKCEWCNNTFFKKKHHVQTILKSGLNKGRYCSLGCKGLARRKRTDGHCKNCGKSIMVKPYQSRNKYQFCSRSCKAKYWNVNKTWGSNRSKLEKWIEVQLSGKYPNLEIHYNRTDTINAELDIYIPSLKLAVELNGIFHYEPIYGQCKLKDTQNADNYKFQKCFEKGIGLCIIDTHNSRYLKNERDQKFLDIITNIIDPLVR